MKEHYEVTIGIPVYRSVDYIQETMNSALNQSFTDVEFLIVDDCGNDGTMDVISRLQTSHPRGNDIRIMVNEKNKGVSYSRNRIIDEARGRFLYFMDSDDTIEPNTIQLLYDAIIQNHVQVAYGSYEIIDRIGNSPIEKYQKDALVLKGEDELAMYAFRNNRIFHVSVCNHLISIQFLRQSNVRFIEASYWEDMVYTTELVTKTESAVLLPDITYHYFRHPNSLSHYQGRSVFEKSEILHNASIIKRLKDKCLTLRGKPYLPYLCYNLEMNSFYVVCLIMKQSHRIVPVITSIEMRGILNHPMSFLDVLSFRHKFFPNFVFWILSRLPSFVSLSFVKQLGKIKKVL